jgi:hypothetical protein
MMNGAAPAPVSSASRSWAHKLSLKMALISLLLPLPSLLFGSALWTLVPKPYRMLHHGGTMAENAEWMASNGANMPAQLSDTLAVGWNSAPLRSSSGTQHARDDALQDLDALDVGARTPPPPPNNLATPDKKGG